MVKIGKYKKWHFEKYLKLKNYPQNKKIIKFKNLVTGPQIKYYQKTNHS
jgi:hypothetical protein